MFYLSKRSLGNLEGVNEGLVEVVHRAIELTEVDFAVIDGVRSLAKQKEYVASGASWTMKSKHITGDAVDLMAYHRKRACWELDFYDEIADAMREAALEVGVGIRWGACWNIPDICDWKGTTEEAVQCYIVEKVAQGKRPKIDAPHFELA